MQTNLKVELITHTPDPEKLIATAAKLCYSELGIKDIWTNLSGMEILKFVGMLSDIGHESPMEHISFTFAAEGISRSLTHQLVRHRHASYSQKSQRYVSELNFEYVIPPEIAKSRRATNIYIGHMEITQRGYDFLIKELMDTKIEERFPNGVTAKEHDKLLKEAQEDARYILPNACETKIVFTMNARELLHFFNHRCCNRAQWEIRAMATQMSQIVYDIAPTVFKNAGPNCLSGSCPEGKMTCGKISEVKELFGR